MTLKFSTFLSLHWRRTSAWAICSLFSISPERKSRGLSAWLLSSPSNDEPEAGGTALRCFLPTPTVSVMDVGRIPLEWHLPNQKTSSCLKPLCETGTEAKLGSEWSIFTMKGRVFLWKNNTRIILRSFLKMLVVHLPFINNIYFSKKSLNSRD